MGPYTDSLRNLNTTVYASNNNFQKSLERLWEKSLNPEELKLSLPKWAILLLDAKIPIKLLVRGTSYPRYLSYERPCCISTFLKYTEVETTATRKAYHIMGEFVFQDPKLYIQLY